MKFIETHFTKIVLGLLLIIFMQQCSSSRRIGSLEKQAKLANARLDSTVTQDNFNKALRIEGLKAEMRMIQSTDRKILDVNRQSQIDLELKNLGAK